MTKNNKSESLVLLIDKLAPINNKFRSIQDPILKIETMWDFGEILDEYLKENNFKLHELLYKIYDPYSQIKMSYITRDLGSYCYRIYKYFPDRTQVKKLLNGLKSYSAFREAIPLLFNDKYGLTNEQKKEIISTISENKPVAMIINGLRNKKRQIRPINNPRNQKAKEYFIEKQYLSFVKDKLKEFYRDNVTLPSESIIVKYFYRLELRIALVNILMALASESFLNNINDIDKNILGVEMSNIFNIAKSNSQNRARFRKWSFSTHELLNMAEAIHSMGEKNNYENHRSKILVNIDKN